MCICSVDHSPFPAPLTNDFAPRSRVLSDFALEGLFSECTPVLFRNVAQTGLCCMLWFVPEVDVVPGWACGLMHLLGAVDEVRSPFAVCGNC